MVALLCSWVPKHLPGTCFGRENGGTLGALTPSCSPGHVCCFFFLMCIESCCVPASIYKLILTSTPQSRLKSFCFVGIDLGTVLPEIRQTECSEYIASCFLPNQLGSSRYLLSSPGTGSVFMLRVKDWTKPYWSLPPGDHGLLQIAIMFQVIDSIINYWCAECCAGY